MKRLATLCAVLLLAGCSLFSSTSPVTPGQLASDGLACAVAIGAEVAMGVADPVFQALGKNPNVADILHALQEAGSMLPATIAACTPLANDVHLALASASSPTAKMARSTSAASRAVAAPGALPNPWAQ